jgi:hypothetical protein
MANAQYPKLTADDIATVTAFFAYVDTDKDGSISISEIRTAVAVDVDGDGTTTTAEIDASALPWLSDFVNQDADASGGITLHELLSYNNSIRA